MEIIHISAECYPAAKAGGLADVVGSLPKYQAQLGHSTKVVMPCYHNKFKEQHTFKSIFTGKARLGQHDFNFSVLVPTDTDFGYELCMIDIPGLFDRPNIYSYGDDTERFITFQVAVINWLNMRDTVPDVVHCHDQHTGFIPFFMSKIFDYRRFEHVPTVFTIHNGEYQGQFGFDKLHYLPPFHSFYSGILEWNNAINPLACAIKSSWRVTTVSPSYLEEINHTMRGLQDLLRSERHKSVGILNGIDVDVWNPETDPMLEKQFGVSNSTEGKKANKAWLCKEFGLDPKKPLFTFIGRLVGEKGADILPQAIHDAFSTFGRELNFLVLGSGEYWIEGELRRMEGLYKGNYCSYIGYNERLSHMIYAGADFLLMPSRVEPCGLNQMYALRYGTVPVVRRTGGLRDTIMDIGDNGYGICHDLCTPDDVIHSIGRALPFYNSKKEFAQNRARIMELDFSWTLAAKKYIDLYTI
jgi:starch synthase